MLALQDVLKPFLLSLESKSPKLANISLASIQKMVANDAITEEHLLTVVKALEQVGRQLSSLIAGAVGSQLC